MREMEEYIEQIMDIANLAPRDTRRVRSELAGHIHEMYEYGIKKGVQEKEIIAMVKKEFGEPKDLGEMIEKSKGKFRTYIKKKTRSFIIQFAIAILIAILLWSVVLQQYYVTTDALLPLVSKESRLLVNKLAQDFKIGDVIVYRDEKINIMGFIKNVDANGTVLISRKGENDRLVEKEKIVGRGFFQYGLIKVEPTTE